MSTKRKIMIVTGTRADYGLLRNVIREVHTHPSLELKLVVTGTHLDPAHNTIKEIEADGFPIAAKLAILSGQTSANDIAHATAKSLTSINEYISTDRPDIAVLLGDRYEMFAAATACLIQHVPVAHIHGGELTFGAIDDAFRHAMTKMSWWHLTSAEVYKNRVIKLGEDPSRVFNVGAPALDALDESNMTREELENDLGMKLISPVLLVTLHPETQSPGKALEHTRILCEGIIQSSAATVIFTKANADAEGNEINNYLDKAAPEFKNGKLVTSLGQKRYLSLLRVSDAGVGNSSSLVIEAPMVKTPSVNIGLRQEGRLRCSSILDVPFEVSKITEAINKAVSPDFKKNVQHPFGEKGVAKRITEILATAPIPKTLVKGFYE